METKLFEVRDRITFLPVIAIKLEPGNEPDRYLLAMVGYGLRAQKQSQYILMGKLQTGKLKCTPSSHAGYPAVRTLPMAHHHVLKHWDELTSGDVIDVEFILGEVPAPKISQRVE
jgi:hypothetical protein